MPIQRIEDEWRALLRVGGCCALIFAFLTLFPIFLVVLFPQPPKTGGAAILEYILAHRVVYLAELLCWVGLAVPAIPTFAALGLALGRTNRSWAVLGALFGIVSEVIALALGSSPPSLSGGLLGLADNYAKASP